MNRTCHSINGGSLGKTLIVPYIYIYFKEYLYFMNVGFLEFTLTVPLKINIYVDIYI